MSFNNKSLENMKAILLTGPHCKIQVHDRKITEIVEGNIKFGKNKLNKFIEQYKDIFACLPHNGEYIFEVVIDNVIKIIDIKTINNVRINHEIYKKRLQYLQDLNINHPLVEIISPEASTFPLKEYEFPILIRPLIQIDTYNTDHIIKPNHKRGIFLVVGTGIHREQMVYLVADQQLTVFGYVKNSPFGDVTHEYLEEHKLKVPSIIRDVQIFKTWYVVQANYPKSKGVNNLIQIIHVTPSSHIEADKVYDILHYISLASTEKKGKLENIYTEDILHEIERRADVLLFERNNSADPHKIVDALNVLRSSFPKKRKRMT